jgi:CheY-like chemotaxis protein
MFEPMGACILIVDDSPTIRKIVAGILGRRDYEIMVAADGVEALARLAERPADLVLVDFVMPRMNGYQLCRELRLHEEYRKIPIVLMSAKGDKIRGKFVEQTGALDAITKPFDARGLVAVIESALKKSAAGDHRTAEGELADEEPISRPSAEVTSVQRMSAAQALADALAELLLPEFETVQGVTEKAVREALRRAIDPKTAAEVSAMLRAVDFGEQAGEVLSGDLSVISIAEILQVLDLERQSGALTVTSKKAQVVLHIREGTLDFATYLGLPEEFLLGRYLVDAGAVTREKLEETLQEKDPSDGRVLGEYLVAEWMISPEDLTKALTQQTSELLYEVVRWRKGRFRFLHLAENAMAQQARLGLPTGGLIMEGFRRVDEWRLIEDSFDFNDVLFRDEMAIEKLVQQGKLTSQERSVLDHIDGETTVGEVVDAVAGGSFEVCKILYQFLNSRLVRRRAAA